MPWLLLLHITALLCWCAALIYLPALMIARARKPQVDTDIIAQKRLMPRAIYTLVATPAALAAIMSGTLVFLAYGIAQAWLVIKLGLVTLLVFGHLLLAPIVVRAENNAQPTRASHCLLLVLVVSGLMIAIVGLVLAKPMQGL